ncbi:hypothetical protein EC844_110100 [Acinetobacter calcoaceticus]|uniref:Uncharacterized protein n=1 Tax=Acinetobacter calcoaceticus TaxID=471 RepID=A0A4R1XTX9_ACICA|nr:hypothetical protein EC844_110100 [Acinetobacter calcoaceticus]
MKKYILAFACLISTVSFAKVNWQPVVESEGYKVSFDANSFDIDEGIVSFELFTQMTYPDGHQPKNYITAKTVKYSVDCKNSLLLERRSLVVDNKSWQKPNGPKVVWSPILPNTEVKMMQDLLCK